MFNIGSGELLIIFLVALIFLGPTRLPEVARQMGQTVATLRSLASGFQAEVEAAAKPILQPERDASADAAMTMDGPTSQDEAIAQTQTDPDVIARAAREVEYDVEGEASMSDGGPTSLRDEQE